MLNRTIAKFLFYGVALVLLAWTSSLTYSFLAMALPGQFWLIPLLGLVVFDVGMIAWLFVFLSHAEGAIQRAAAIILCLFNFVGVGLMTISEILLSGQTMAAAPAMLGTVAIWGIGIWTTVNVLGVLVFHLGDPAARREMAIQAEKDAIVEGAISKLKSRRMDNEDRIADVLSASMFAQVESELRADKDRNGVPDLMERGRQSAPQLPVPDTDQADFLAALRQMVDAGQLVIPVSQPGKTTHDAANAGPGQGNGPAAKPLGGKPADFR